MSKSPTDQQILIYQLYADYGRAVLEAQRFEINLGLTLLYLEGRKRSLVKMRSREEVDALLDEIDGEAIGRLLSRLSEFHIPKDVDTIELFELAAANRNTLVHHFMKEEVEDLDTISLRKAIDRVASLQEPIIKAKNESEALAIAEDSRMRAEIESRGSV
ncbi:MAG: hypothetical protein AAF697_10850 [Pseudomonadota bacterium]